MNIDPVCNAALDPHRAAARVEYAGQSYWFCSEACHKAFTREPHRYVRDVRAEPAKSTASAETSFDGNEA